MATGTIVRWLERGFGFIERDDGGANIFVHIRDVAVSADALAIGQTVEFTEAVDKRRGKLEAKRVTLLAPIIDPRGEVLEDAERVFRSARFMRSET